MSFKRDLDSIFFRRQDEQLATYDVKKMREEAAELKRKGVRAKDPLGKTTAALKAQAAKVKSERKQRDDLLTEMFNAGATDKEIANRLSVPPRTVASMRDRLGLERKKK